MTTSSVSHSALQFALAALANSGSGGGGGGGEGSTVKVRVAATITGAPGTNASVVNLGTDEDVLLQFTIPQGAKGEQGEVGPEGQVGPQGEPGKDGKPGSQWLTSDQEPGTPVEGAVNGDMVLYSSGEVYKVENGELHNTNIDLIPDTPVGGMDPYQYALSIGFVGTKTEFDMRFLSALADVTTNTEVSGGIAGERTGDEVTVDGGQGGVKNWEIVMSGNNSLQQ